MTIDWSAIGRFEGNRLDGYVPDAANSNSGVTIATGVDLGQQTWQSMRALPDRVLAIMLRPYLGLRQKSALDMLAANPLRITQRQADSLNSFVRRGAADELRLAYGASDAACAFDALPDAVQTVIASVHFQYGNLAAKCPHFWATAVAGDWAAMRRELLNFGDHYPTRRGEEAAMLTPLIEV